MIKYLCDYCKKEFKKEDLEMVIFHYNKQITQIGGLQQKPDRFDFVEIMACNGCVEKIEEEIKNTFMYRLFNNRIEKDCEL